ncbi:MAG TPA: transposase, partial [Anaerolineae bacterium]|nr:transposase [Anaerolineae bacterium]
MLIQGLYTDLRGVAAVIESDLAQSRGGSHAAGHVGTRIRSTVWPGSRAWEPALLLRKGGNPQMSYRRRPVLSEATFFITCVTYKRKPHFADPELAQIVIDQWKHYAAAYQFGLITYCIMPEHYHVVTNVGKSKTISQILHAVNSYSATLLNQHLGQASKIKIWEGHAWDEVVRDEDMFWQKIAYTLFNP